MHISLSEFHCFPLDIWLAMFHGNVHGLQTWKLLQNNTNTQKNTHNTENHKILRTNQKGLMKFGIYLKLNLQDCQMYYRPQGHSLIFIAGFGFLLLRHISKMSCVKCLKVRHSLVRMNSIKGAPEFTKLKYSRIIIWTKWGSEYYKKVV